MLRKIKISLVFIASIIEGGSLLTYEVLCTKIQTPYLGASIYVWASVLSITLLGLALGYKIGGEVSKKHSRKVWISLCLSGLFLIVSSHLAKLILPYTLDLEIRIASILGGLVLLFIPMVLFGTVSPMLVAIVDEKNDNISSSTGWIYGLGTFSGIVFLLISIYIIMPVIGIENITYILGGLLLISGVLLGIALNKNEY